MAFPVQGVQVPDDKKFPAVHPRCYAAPAPKQASTNEVLEHAVQTPAFKKYPFEHLVATMVLQVAAPVGHGTQALFSTLATFKTNPVIQVVITVSDEQV
jgi:hypothetical protein